MGTEVQIRKATQGDLDRVVELYDAICDYLDATFNYPGWTRGEYPARWTAEQALANGELYVCADGEALLGTCILNGVQPEGYQDIPWQEGISPAEVLVVHTLAVHPCPSAGRCFRTSAAVRRTICPRTWKAQHPLGRL